MIMAYAMIRTRNEESRFTLSFSVSPEERDALCRSKWCVGVNNIVAGMR